MIKTGEELMNVVGVIIDSVLSVVTKKPPRTIGSSLYVIRGKAKIPDGEIAVNYEILALIGTCTALRKRSRMDHSEECQQRKKTNDMADHCQNGYFHLQIQNSSQR